MFHVQLQLIYNILLAFQFLQLLLIVLGYVGERRADILPLVWYLRIARRPPFDNTLRFHCLAKFLNLVFYISSLLFRIYNY